MKKFFAAVITAAAVILLGYHLYAQGYLDNTPIYDMVYNFSYLAGERLPSPIEEGSLLSFYNTENIGVECTGESVRVSGVCGSVSKTNILVRLEDEGNEVAQDTVRVKRGEPFSVTLRVPSSNRSDRLEVAVFANSTAYGTYTGWVTDYIYIQRGSNGWYMTDPVVYGHNAEVFSKDKPLEAALWKTHNVQADNVSVRKLAERVTEGCKSDYERAAAIHDYICDNFYYDHDMAQMDVIAIGNALEIIASNRGLCSGYANAYAAMCRSLNIPCVVVTGYVLGIDSEEDSWNGENSLITKPNHAWNEVYADGRWVIVDTTWDCGNSYKNGHIDEQLGTNHLYFDANLKYFSANHKILKYRDI